MNNLLELGGAQTGYPMFWTHLTRSYYLKDGNWVRFNLVNDIVTHELLREMTWSCK